MKIMCLENLALYGYIQYSTVQCTKQFLHYSGDAFTHFPHTCSFAGPHFSFMLTTIFDGRPHMGRMPVMRYELCATCTQTFDPLKVVAQ